MEKEGVKFRANQGLNMIMKRSVMFHILYDSCVYCTSPMYWNSRGEEAG
jgi:hypothetical protein